MVADVLDDFLPSAGRGAAAGGPQPAAAGSGPLGEIRVGLGSCCVAQGSGQVHHAIEEPLAETGRRPR